MSIEPAAPPPDDKDWTWVLDKPCADCGFDAPSVTFEHLPEVLASTGERWQRVVERPDVRVRPAPQTWSPLEYAAHVRDVYTIFTDRARLMLTEDEPTFANWDQDETALQKRYWECDPAQLSGEIAAAAGSATEVFAGVRPDQCERIGFRSNGSVFTVSSLGSYFLHDLVHHLHDVRG